MCRRYIRDITSILTYCDMYTIDIFVCQSVDITTKRKLSSEKHFSIVISLLALLGDYRASLHKYCDCIVWNLFWFISLDVAHLFPVHKSYASFTLVFLWFSHMAGTSTQIWRHHWSYARLNRVCMLLMLLLLMMMMVIMISHSLDLIIYIVQRL